MMMMIVRYCNQRLLFEFIFDIRASTFNSFESSSSTEKYLQKEQTIKKSENYSEKWKWSNWMPTIWITIICRFPLSYPRPPSGKLKMAWPPSRTSQHQIEILLVGKIDPSPPQLLQLPGLHLPGFLPPLQLPCLSHCRAGYLLPGHEQKCHKKQNLDLDLDFDLDLQVEENWVKNSRTCSGT